MFTCFTYWVLLGILWHGGGSADVILRQSVSGTPYSLQNIHCIILVGLFHISWCSFRDSALTILTFNEALNQQNIVRIDDSNYQRIKEKTLFRKDLDLPGNHHGF